jgi:hypothetical protein
VDADSILIPSGVLKVLFRASICGAAPLPYNIVKIIIYCTMAHTSPMSASNLSFTDLDVGHLLGS